MDDKTSGEIRQAMRKVFLQYSGLRDRKCDGNTPFWDAVVLTTFDEAQRRCFEEQVERKREGGQLPQVPIFVVADPPGQKLGVGGSTLHVLSELSSKFGDELFRKKLLIIHSGGSSQRLPSYSVLGKIFSPVPVEGLCVSGGGGVGVPQMLDLKLAMYLPLCRLLGPGILVTCADDIETYCLDVDALDTEALAGADVVALGHPSSLAVGTGHGVYVLGGGGAAVAQSSSSSVQECMEVLQKPSVSAMRTSGAVFRRGRREGRGGEGGGGNEQQNEEEQEEEEVWSDSVFWMGGELCGRLLRWYEENRPLGRELDAYAHILPCLGVRAGQGEAWQTGAGQDFRSEMLPLLQGASFRVIALPRSKFYHLGTMVEYVANYNTAHDFTTELGIVRNTSNKQGGVEECVSNPNTAHNFSTELGEVRDASNRQGKRCEGPLGEEEEEENEGVQKLGDRLGCGNRDRGREGELGEKEEENGGARKLGDRLGKEENGKGGVGKLGDRLGSGNRGEGRESELWEKEEQKNGEGGVHVLGDRLGSAGGLGGVLGGRYRTPKSLRPQGTIIESVFLTPDARIRVPDAGTHYVIEQCQIGGTLRLGGDAILSNCDILPRPGFSRGTEVLIPSDTLFHTVPVKQECQSLYVTVAFDLDAKMKAEGRDLKDIKVFGRTLKDYVDVLGLREEAVRQGDACLSLWGARIFPAAKTAHESFWVTCEAVQRVKGGCEGVARVKGECEGVLDGREGPGIVSGGCARLQGVVMDCGRKKLEVERCGGKEEEEEEVEERCGDNKEGCRRKKLAVGRCGENEEVKERYGEKEVGKGCGERKEEVGRYGGKERVEEGYGERKEEMEEDGENESVEKRLGRREKGCGEELERLGGKEEVEERCSRGKEDVEGWRYEGELFSMSDVVKLKDLNTLLGDRRRLVTLLAEK